MFFNLFSKKRVEIISLRDNIPFKLITLHDILKELKMTDTEIKNICKSNIGPYRFNYINAAKEIARNDRDEEETKSILVAVIRYYDRYDELKISEQVYQWARNYNGPIADEYDYRDLWNVNTDHLSDMIEEYIYIVDRPFLWT